MDDLGAQERAVLDAITANPFVGQQEIASALGLARSTVAAHVTQLVAKGYLLGRGYVLPKAKRVVCIGGAVLDRKYLAAESLIFATSNPVAGKRSFGGVARNVAENLARLGVEVSLVTIVGEDDTGRALTRHLRDLGVDVSRVVITSERPTAEYAAILGPDHDLVLGVADMAVFDLMTPALLDRVWPHLAAATWVFADCNLPAETLASLIARRHGARFRLAVDAVSTPKAARLPLDLDGIDLLFMNRDEAAAFLERSGRSAPTHIEAVARALVDAGAAEAVVTDGPRGAVVAGASSIERVAAVAAAVVDVTGAGDGMIAGTLSRLIAGERPAAAVATGTLLAALTTETEATVHPDLSPRLLAVRAGRVPEPVEA